MLQQIILALRFRLTETEPNRFFGFRLSGILDLISEENRILIRFGSVRLSDIYLILFNSEKTEKKYFKKKNRFKRLFRLLSVNLGYRLSPV